MLTGFGIGGDRSGFGRRRRLQLSGRNNDRQGNAPHPQTAHCRRDGCRRKRRHFLSSSPGGTGPGHHGMVRRDCRPPRSPAFTFFGYAIVYTLFLKKRTPQNIVIGGALRGDAAAAGMVRRHRRSGTGSDASFPDYLCVDAAAFLGAGAGPTGGLPPQRPADAAGDARTALHRRTNPPVRAGLVGRFHAALRQRHGGIALFARRLGAQRPLCPSGLANLADTG